VTRIGLIGTGMLGKAVGLHLLESGYQLAVFNRTKSKTEELVEHGANVLESPKEVAKKSDLIFTIVKDANAVKEVSFAKNGIVEGLNFGRIIFFLHFLPSIFLFQILKLQIQYAQLSCHLV